MKRIRQWLVSLFTKEDDMPASYLLTVYMDKREEWRWHITASNGKKIADGGEGYSTRHNAIRAARRLRVIAPVAKLVG